MIDVDVLLRRALEAVHSHETAPIRLCTCGCGAELQVNREACVLGLLVESVQPAVRYARFESTYPFATTACRDRWSRQGSPIDFAEIDTPATRPWYWCAHCLDLREVGNPVLARGDDFCASKTRGAVIDLLGKQLRVHRTLTLPPIRVQDCRQCQNQRVQGFCAGFLYAEPGDPEWQPWWAEYGEKNFDRAFDVTVYALDYARHARPVRLADGCEHLLLNNWELLYPTGEVVPLIAPERQLWARRLGAPFDLIAPDGAVARLRPEAVVARYVVENPRRLNARYRASRVFAPVPVQTA